MEFLKDYIGLTGVNETPKSGLLLNNLPGIESELLLQVKNSEAALLSDVWSKIQERAFLRLGSQALAIINEAKDFNELLYRQTGFRPVMPINYPEIIEGEERLRGVVVRVPEAQFVEVRLKEIQLVALEAAAPVSLRIFNLHTGQEVAAPLELTIRAGFNRIEVDKILSTEFGDLFIFVGVSDLEVKLAAVSGQTYWIDRAAASCPDAFDVYPATLSSLDYDTEAARIDPSGMLEEYNAAGFSIELDVSNSIAKYIELNRRPFALALWYLLGAETLREKLSSPRQNFFASGNIVRTEETLKRFEADFARELRNAVKSIDLQSFAWSPKASNPETGFGSAYLEA